MKNEIERRRHRRWKVLPVVAAATLFGVTCPAVAANYTFTNVDVPGAFQTFPQDITNQSLI
jgi:hypothetical protein